MTTGAMSESPFGTVLITGASGFIGRHLQSALLDQGADVVALKRAGSPPATRGRSVAIDYADRSSLETVFATEQPTHVFHVAGATKGVTYEDFAKANVTPTMNLIEAAKASPSPLKRFVLVSSLAAWGPSTPERPHSESDTPQPIEFYGQSKLEAEQLLQASTIPYTIIRPGGVYGPGDVDYFQLFQSAHRGFNVYFGNRNRWMSIVYVDDLVNLCLASATHPAAADRGYFATDGQPLTWETFQKEVVHAANRKVRDIDVPGFVASMAGWGGELMSRLDGKPRLANRQKVKMGEQDAWTATIEAAQKELSYQPKTSLSDGVSTTMSWYRETGWI